MGRLFLLLCLLAAPLLARSPQDVADAPAATVPCPSCAGKGERLQECLLCHGEKTRPCRTCTLQFSNLVPPDRDETQSLQQRIDAIAELREKMGELGDDPMAKLLGTRDVGYKRCPATCKDGQVLLQPEDKCLYCRGKGQLKCPDCRKKGVLKCVLCKGKGQRKRACADCVGTGRIPDPARVPEDQRGTCTWCAGSEKRGCGDCLEGTEVRVCTSCDGEKAWTCGKCVGSKEKPCNKCYASGNLSRYLAAKSSNRCDQCKVTARIPCDVCAEKGKKPCATCRGEGRVEGGCLACLSDREVPCAGCFHGLYRSWEVNAEALEAAGDLAGAHAFLTLAEERVNPLYRQRMERPTELVVDVKATERLRKKELSRLQKRLKALERALEGE